MLEHLSIWEIRMDCGSEERLQRKDRNTSSAFPDGYGLNQHVPKLYSGMFQTYQ